jgi:hypothetical protein
MSERHWQRPALASTALALLGATAVAGCGGPASTSRASTSRASSTSPASATHAAGVATATGHVQSLTATQLKGALLTKVGTARPAAPAEAGDYGALPDVQTSKQTMHGVKVTPARCAQATVTGFNSAAFTHAPASVVTFRVGRDGVSEVLVSAKPDVASSALGNKLPAGCQHYTASVGGKTFHYTVKQSPVAGLGQEARALNVKAAGYSQVNVWSVVYRADGFVGAVTIVGPDASQASAKKLASQAYAYARQSLS